MLQGGRRSATLLLVATACAVPGPPARERAVAPAVAGQCGRLETMFEWTTAEVRAVGVVIAVLALLATLAYRWLVGHKRDFQLLFERIDREAEKREQETREIAARFEREAEKREQKTREIAARFEREAEKREQETREIAARFEREAEKREQETREITARFEREAEKREQETREIIARIDREAQQRQLQIDREADKRERGIQAALDRSDRAFEALTAQANALTKELAGVAQRTARSEGTLETIAGGAPRTESKSSSAADKPRTIAAQHVPGEPPAE